MDMKKTEKINIGRYSSIVHNFFLDLKVLVKIKNTNQRTNFEFFHSQN